MKDTVKDFLAPQSSDSSEDEGRRRRRDVVDNDNVMRSGSDSAGDRNIFKDIVDAAKGVIETVRNIFTGGQNGGDASKNFETVADDVEMI